jgi:hypothetical protein
MVSGTAINCLLLSLPLKMLKFICRVLQDSRAPHRIILLPDSAIILPLPPLYRVFIFKPDSTTKYIYNILQPDPITMPREFRHLVMMNIRRVAHSPREAKNIARLLLMQVILVCVAHAAQNAWMKGRMAGGDPGVDVKPEEMPANATSEIIAFVEGIPRPLPLSRSEHCGMVLLTGRRASTASLVGPVLPADSGQRR